MDVRWHAATALRTCDVVPMWESFSHTADEASTLYEISDEPAMRLLGHYCEDRARL